jgi:hypothetical protein
MTLLAQSDLCALIFCIVSFTAMSGLSVAFAVATDAGFLKKLWEKDTTLPVLATFIAPTPFFTGMNAVDHLLEVNVANTVVLGGVIIDDFEIATKRC